MPTKRVYGTSELAFGNALSSYRLGENTSKKEFVEVPEISVQSLCAMEKGRGTSCPG